MNCQEARTRIPDLLQEGAGAAAEALRAHIAACPACCREWQELSDTWTRLGLLPEESPSPKLRRDFYRLLEAARSEAAPAMRPPWRQRLRALLPDLRPLAPAMRLAAALVIVAGFGAGFFIGRRNPAAAEQVQLLRSEVGQLRQQASLSLLNQSSASARLQGLSLAAKQQDPGEELLGKLLDILDNDPSVNVRLAAVDALYIFAGNSGVRADLSSSLARQTSPQVQVALIDLLVSLKEKQAAAALKKLVADNKILPEVQQRARSGMERIL